MGITSIIFVAWRFGIRLYTKIDIGLDDWTILVTIILLVANIALYEVGLLKNGLGRNVWILPAPSNTTFIYYIYIVEAAYLVMISFVEISILFFYLRIFPSALIRRIL
jgi:hypothetical protein